MHIGILGGSGRTGRCIIEEAQHRWHTISTLVRHPESHTRLSNSITILQGDATITEDVRRLIDTGIDTLIHTVSVPFFHHKPTTVYSQIAQAVIDAWPAEEWPKQYLVLSSFGTHHGRNLARPFNRGYELFLGDVADDKEQEEALLEASSLPWTIVKAVLLNNNDSTVYTPQAFSSFVPTISKHISRKTVAHACLDIVEQQLFLHKKIVVS